MAIAISPDGQLDFRSEGDTLRLQPPGILINSISPEAVEVTYQGMKTTWQMGQVLSFKQASQPTDSSAKIPIANPSDSATAQPREAVKRMSIEEELDSLNGRSRNNDQ